MQIKILNRGHLLIAFTTPDFLIMRKDENGDIEIGPYLSNADSGIFYSKYDFGNMLKIKVLGFGIDIWWMV